MNARKKVLLIEDEKSLSVALKDYLDAIGYEVDVAYDGQEALDKIGKWFPDIILLDILMPKLGGLETLKILKSLPETSNIPVIILTNVEDEKSEEEAKKSGVEYYFIKGKSPLSLISTCIHELLKK